MANGTLYDNLDETLEEQTTRNFRVTEIFNQIYKLLDDINEIYYIEEDGEIHARMFDAIDSVDRLWDEAKIQETKKALG